MATLNDHYERKYAHESTVVSISTVPLVTIPLSRDEAVIKYFRRSFKGGRILELGAGDGSVAKSLLESDLSIASYTLTDISLPRLQGLKNNLLDPRLQIAALDAEAIPPEHYEKYDAVIMVALVEHLLDPMRVMQTIWQTLRKGGYVYIDTPNIAKYTQRLKLLAGRFPSTASKNEGLTTFAGRPVDVFEEGHLHYFTYRSLSLMLTTRCGFSGVENSATRAVEEYSAEWSTVFSPLDGLNYFPNWR